jgi:hypothetical protein
VELFLLDRNIPYEASDEKRYTGDRAARGSGDLALLAGGSSAAVGIRSARRACGDSRPRRAGRVAGAGRHREVRSLLEP